MCSNRYINNSFNNNGNNWDDVMRAAYNGTFPSTLRYGNAYVPVQTLRNVYSPREGLSYGSMFPELVFPYSPNQSLAEVNYLRNYNERGCR